MNTRVNETLYQDNAVELDDEALAKIIGGSGGYGNEPCYEDYNPCQEEAMKRRHRDLLGDLLCDLL